MKPLKIYLETTVFNFYYAGDAPDKRQDTVALFAEILADKYVSEDIIPEKFRVDGIHIAMATINDLDIIVSYNFRHIVKLRTIIGTESINLREGYKRIGIFSPTEVIENEE